MIDLHCHILPNLDDGAGDLVDSIEMARLAVEGGTRIIAATPHSYYIDRYAPGDEVETVMRTFEYLESALKKEKINLDLVTGMEILGDIDTAQRLENGSLITINNTKYPLIEFDFDVDEDFIWNVMQDVKSAGYKPILAHPERYHCLYYNTSYAYDLYKSNVILQVNKGSILGHFGRRVEIVADKLLEHRLAAIVASDAHNIYRRTPDMFNLADYLDDDFGEGCSNLLLNENPNRILNDQDIILAEPIEL